MPAYSDALQTRAGRRVFAQGAHNTYACCIFYSSRPLAVYDSIFATISFRAPVYEQSSRYAGLLSHMPNIVEQ